MSAAQDRAEALIRARCTVDGICILPEWPGYARRIVAALEGVDRLGWGALREAFGTEEYDGAYGGDLVVRHLVDDGVIERVFWDVTTGQEVEGPADLHALMVRLSAPEWQTWAASTCIGYRFARHVIEA